jgi:hypothetical protein
MKALNEQEREAIFSWWSQNDPDETRFECADNFRYAIKGNGSQEHLYNEIQRHGCCGFVDVEIPLPNGTTLLYGFNYGH